MQRAWLVQLYGYGRWANERIVDSCAAVPLSVFTAPAGIGYGSLRDTLVHSAWSEWIWLSRCRGVSPRERWDLSDFPDVPALRTRWATIDDEAVAFVGALSDADLMRAVTYTNTSGVAQRTQPLWEILLHQAMHAGQHRAEAAYLLTQAGHSPGDLDLLQYQINQPR